MPDKARKAYSSTVISRRFWTLLIIVMVLAVTSSAVAVQLTATPFLKKQQNEAIVTQAERDARNLEVRLDRHRLLLGYIGNTPEFVGVVMGHVTNADVVFDKFQLIHRPEAMSWASLHDAFGETIADLTIRSADRSIFSERDIQSLIHAFANEMDTAGRQVLFRSIDGFAHVVLAVPVYNGGFVEGVLLGGFRIDEASVFPPNEIAKHTRIAKTDMDGIVPHASERAVVVALEQATLAVMLVPDIQAIEAAGARLVTTVVCAIAAVLTLAFGIFAALGRKSLIEPHRKLEQQKKALSELAAIAERANDAIVVTDIDALITWTNPAFERLSGHDAANIIGKKPGTFLQGEDTDPATVAKLRKAIRQQSPIKTEILNYTAHGHPYWVSITVTPLRNDDGKCYGFVAISHDITQSRAQRDAILSAKQEIEHQALHDPLTGLPNRRALDVALQARNEDKDSSATLVRIDLDHFKYVNDTLGHEAGDFALCEVAQIMKEEIDEGDLPVRVGGDEFVIFLAKGKSSADGEKLARAMLDRIREPKSFGTKTIRIGASFGVASTLDKLLNQNQLIVGADAALYEAKDLGRNRVRLYSPELHREVLNRRSLAREIRRAIAKEEFVPFFQPQFCAQTHEIAGVEVLARWDSPELGLLTPNKFLPVAHQLSAVDDIDALLFQKAVSQIEALGPIGIEIPKISFNVTAERIHNPDVYLELMKRGPGGPKIAFEILESVLVEEQSDLFRFSLDRLREMGVSIEIDDFGSGHASIVGLMHVQPDVMKIDQQLVKPIIQSETARGLLKQIVGMADLMGLNVTAEGVETYEHAKLLADLGCHTLQGYAFSKPLCLDDLKSFVMSLEENGTASFPAFQNSV